MSEAELTNSSSSKPGDRRTTAPKLFLPQQRKSQKTDGSSRGFIRLFIFSVQVALLLSASASILYGLFYFPLPFLSLGSYPAGIPWVTTQDSCEQTGRTWQQGHCFDYDHNPIF